MAKNIIYSEDNKLSDVSQAAPSDAADNTQSVAYTPDNMINDSITYIKGSANDIDSMNGVPEVNQPVVIPADPNPQPSTAIIVQDVKRNETRQVIRDPVDANNGL
jgi:hypothetical protein